MFKRIFAIASTGFKEGIRERILYLLLLFALLMLFSSYGLAALSMGEYIKVTQDVGLASIMIFGVLIAIFMGASIIYKDIEQKTIYTILTKPIKRPEYLIGRFLGLSSLVFVVTIFMAAIFFAILFSFNRNVYYTQWAIRTIFTGDIALAIVYSYLSMLIVIAISIFFSTFTSPIVASIMTFFVYIIGNGLDTIKSLVDKVNSETAKVLLRVLYYVLPNFSNLNLRDLAIYGIVPSTSHLLMLVVYTAVYIAIMLMLSAFVFNRKEMR
jgi:ABC-2 type transport system permease protein